MTQAVAAGKENLADDAAAICAKATELLPLLQEAQDTLQWHRQANAPKDDAYCELLIPHFYALICSAPPSDVWGVVMHDLKAVVAVMQRQQSPRGRSACRMRISEESRPKP